MTGSDIPPVKVNWYIPRVRQVTQTEYEMGVNSDRAIEPSIEESQKKNDRGHWGSRWEFLLSCIGLSVGIGNVWRFPYLAYSNGGGAFLIPYVILLLLVGKPMYFMEVALGQFSQSGPISVWRLSPLFIGAGYGMVAVSAIVAVYYNVIMAYSVFYTAASFASELPWTRCQDWWAADQFCYTRSFRSNDSLTYYDVDDQTLYFNGTAVCSSLVHSNSSEDIPCVNVTLQSATKQYWEKYVLDLKQDGLTSFGDLGAMSWQLLLCFTFSWLVVCLCVMKGIKSSGKVVYFTATFPYIILLSLLVRGVTMNGAINGIYYFFVPDWERLKDFQVWRKAAEQMFFSLGISWGGLIMFGSYNQFRNRVHIDAFVISSIDFLTSIIAGVATFSILGAISFETGVDIKEIAAAGPGFAFVTFLEAISRLPLPQLWAILFFVMLFILGLDTQFALVETCLTCLYDACPFVRQHKTYATIGFCCFFYLFGLPCLTQAGSYVIDLMDTFGGGTGVLLVAIFEMIGIMWVYGVDRFCDDLHFMLNFRPNNYWKICWAFCCPVFLVVIFAFATVNFQEPLMGSQPYPRWAIGIGWSLLLAVILPVPVLGVINGIKYYRKGNLNGVIRPTDSWGPGDAKYFETWRQLYVAKPMLDDQCVVFGNVALDVME